jgi:hypothetical protein
MKITPALTFVLGLVAGGLLVSAALGAGGGRPLLPLCPLPAALTNPGSSPGAAPDRPAAPW